MKPGQRGFVAVGFLVCLQASTWACRARVPPTAAPALPSTQEPPADECAVLSEPGEPVATVGVAGPIDPSKAPRPSNDSERLLFRQVYETLVRIDCRGRVAPALAESWRLDTDGRTWVVTLRENARFSDGSPVTAADVRAVWMREGIGDELRPDVGHLVQSVAPVSDRVLAMTLRSPRTDVPAALAHPDLAIARPAAGSAWPLGTRSVRVDQDAANVITIARDDLPPIRFLLAPGDPRDLLDQGVDLLLTRDPATLDYAATLPHYQRVPLAWHRLYVLLAPGRSPSSPSLPEEARQALADDAVRGEARGARGPFWWQMVQECEVTPPARREPAPPTPRIVYDAADGAARDLAERLVGLARAPGPAAAVFLDALLPDRPRRTYQRATGLTGDALARTMRLGADAGYLMSVDSRPIDGCRDLQSLMDLGPWLDPGTLVPLVETRLQAVVRRGRSGVTAEWDGGVAIAGGRDPR